jgi:hypothetical protein
MAAGRQPGPLRRATRRQSMRRGSLSGGSNQPGNVGEEDVYKQSFPFQAAAARHRSLTSHRDINRRDMAWYNTVC